MTIPKNVRNRCALFILLSQEHHSCSSIQPKENLFPTVTVSLNKLVGQVVKVDKTVDKTEEVEWTDRSEVKKTIAVTPLDDGNKQCSRPFCVRKDIRRETVKDKQRK